MSRLILASRLPTDAETGAPLPGYVQVGTTSDGRVILDASRDAPEVGELLSEGHGRYARAALGSHADRVLEAAWERSVEGGKEHVREKMRAALARNPTVTLTASDLPPHRWFGEEGE